MSRLVCLPFVLSAATAAAAPSGRVVRIERAGASQTAPRLCEIHGDSGKCLGEQPRPGQTVVVIDERRTVSEVQIVDATSTGASCANLWAVTTRKVRGAAPDGEGIGVIDPALDPTRARVLDKARLPASPTGEPGNDVWRAIDRDGDGIADIVITRYGCDSSSKLVAGASTSCMEVWARTGAKFVRTTQLNVAQCNP